MATQVSLFRSSGVLFPSRQAAIRQAVKDVFDGYDPADATIDPATLVAAATVDTQGTEVLGTVDPDNPAHRFHLLAVHVPEDWRPEHELSVPEFGWLGEYERDRDGHDTRQEAFRRLAELNDLQGEDPLFPETGFWFVAVQEGDPIPDETVDSFTFERDRGILTRCQSMPLALVLPTSDEVRDGLTHLVDYRAQEAAENVAHGQQTPSGEPEEDDGESREVSPMGDRTNGHAAGHSDPKQPAKRPTLKQVLRANGFDKFAGGEFDENTMTFDLEFDVSGPWYIPTSGGRVDPEGVLLALAADMEATAAKFRKAAAKGLARSGDDDTSDNLEPSQVA